MADPRTLNDLFLMAVERFAGKPAAFAGPRDDLPDYGCGARIHNGRQRQTNRRLTIMAKRQPN